jgi:hypothetical protein
MLASTCKSTRRCNAEDQHRKIYVPVKKLASKVITNSVLWRILLNVYWIGTAVTKKNKSNPEKKERTSVFLTTLIALWTLQSTDSNSNNNAGLHTRQARHLLLALLIISTSDGYRMRRHQANIDTAAYRLFDTVLNSNKGYMKIRLQ